MKDRSCGFVLVFLLILISFSIMLYLVARRYQLLLINTSTTSSQTIEKVHTPKPSPKVIYQGVQNDNWISFTLAGCSATSFPSQKYVFQIPASWTITQRPLVDEYSELYYDVEGEGASLTIGCFVRGVGGDICDDKYRTNFTIDHRTADACFGNPNGYWSMGVLNLPLDKETQSVTSFWAKGMDKVQLNKIFDSFKFE